MRTLRRSLLLAVISIGGIALLAPLAAQSATSGPVDFADALLPGTGAPALTVDRGGLSGRQAVEARAEAAGTAEDLVAGGLPTPAGAPMEATLYGVPGPSSASPASAPQAVWDALAECESAGSWAINTGNGYYGGLQFSYGTWHTYGGGEFAEYPHQATREQQISVAERIRGGHGFAPWPTCAAELGLP